VSVAHDNISGRLAWTTALREPQSALEWSLGEWERVIRLARRLRLLARLAESLDAAGLLEAVPQAPRRHLVAEQQVSRFRTAAMRWALQRIRDVLGPGMFPCVLLKGAAYLGQDLQIAAGRLPSDIDILVPKAHIAEVQRLLASDGWTEVALDAHDQRYYREWSHEAPPMRHPLHPLELDLHHDILPPLARTHVDIERLLADVRPSRWQGWQVLQPVDQVLHSASHLFQDSQAVDRLRDLIDLDGLMRQFAGSTTFYSDLVARARELGLSEPLAMAFHFCGEWLHTPIPAQAQRELQPRGPTALQRWWLMPTLVSLLTPTDPDAAPPQSQHVAATLFLARYHAGRMPLRLLLPHLLRKLRRRKDNTAPPDGGQGARAAP
jgi:Uncharacterised nucleotidyltransferase